jgi:UDP-2,3-diacylglucosamine hydrolase
MALPKSFRKLHDDGVKTVVMAGKVDRPGLLQLRPDWRTLKFLARAGIQAFTNKASVGDDRLLRAVILEIEREGFSVVGVQDVLSNLLVKQGLVGALAPTHEDQIEIDIGIAAARAHGMADIGQAVVVQNGDVLAKEDLQGTDALIREASTLKQDGPGPLLIKTSKPGQDRRADLPVIGPDTVKACVAAGFRGIVIEAGGTLILDKTNVAEKADQAGLFIIAVECGAEGNSGQGQ